MTLDFPESLLEAEMSRVPATALELQSKSEIRDVVHKGIELALKRTRSPEFAQRFHAACAVEGARDEDYLFRTLELGDGNVAIWGIHFEGSVVRLPFVRIVYSTFDPTAQLELLMSLAKSEFALFSPLRFSFYGPAGLSSAIDTTVFAAHIADIQSLENPEHYERVEARLETDLSFYTEYVAMYNELRMKDPEAFSVQESRESLQDCVAERCMFRILFDGATAGFIALRRDYDRYLSGYYIIEEILSEKFRGRGYAAASQRRVIDQLSSTSDLVIGQIDDRNTPSWRTAMRVGRKPIYSAYWQPLN